MKMRAKEIMLRCFPLQIAEKKRPDPGQHQLTSDGSQGRKGGNLGLCKVLIFTPKNSQFLKPHSTSVAFYLDLLLI